MKKITALLICYMLAVALCATGIVLNSDSSSASSGGLLGKTKNTPLDIILWSIICVATISVLITASAIAWKSKKQKLALTPCRSNS